MIASSTTIPIASTNPNMVSVLMVNPKGMKKQKVDKMDTGIANMGIIVDRQFCRKRNTTNATNVRALINVPITSSIDTRIMVIDSNGTTYSTSEGNDFFSSASF